MPHQSKLCCAQPLVSESCRVVALPDLRVRSWECPTAKKLVLFCTDSQVHATEIFYCKCLIDCHHSSQQGACYLFLLSCVGRGKKRFLCRGTHMKFIGQLADSFFITWSLGVELRSSGLAPNLPCWAISPASGASHTQDFLPFTMTDVCDPSIWEAEPRGLLHVQGQLGLPSETLSQTTKTKPPPSMTTNNNNSVNKTI